MSSRRLMRLSTVVVLIGFAVVASPLYALTIDDVMDDVEQRWLSRETRGEEGGAWVMYSAGRFWTIGNSNQPSGTKP